MEDNPTPILQPAGPHSGLRSQREKYMRYRASTSGIVTSIQGAALITFVALAVVSVLATIASTVGLLPWLNMSLTFGDLRIPNGGAVIQTSVTVLLALLAFFLCPVDDAGAAAGTDAPRLPGLHE